MIRFIKAILGIGANTRKTQKWKEQTRAETSRDYVKEAVNETVYAVRAEQATAKTRYRHIDDRTLDRIIREAIDRSHSEARATARKAARRALNQGKGRIYIVRVGKETAQDIYRKAIDSAIGKYQADLIVPEKRDFEEQAERATDRASKAGQAFAKGQNAALAERESARERYKHLDTSLVESAIQSAINQIDIVGIGHVNLRDKYRKAIDRNIVANIAKTREKRKSTIVAKPVPRRHTRRSKKGSVGSKTSRTNKSKEEKQIRGELEALKEKHRVLYRKRRSVTFRGGKISKNADYHDTKEQLIAVEERIQFYESALANVLNLRSMSENHIVQVGSTVFIRYDDSDEDEIYQIVQTPLLKGSESTISAKSPTGAALLGKRKGDKVRVRTPDGNVKLRVIDVR